MRINHTAPYNSSRFSQPLALLLVGLFLLLSPCAWGVVRQVWDYSIANTLGTGSGQTEKDPILINTPAQLAFLSQQINNGEDYEGKYFKQMADFDMRGSYVTSTSGRFKPIGTKNHPFKGHYDGGGCKIIDLKLDTLKETITDEYDWDYDYYDAALFGYASSATIQNLIIEKVVCFSSTLHLRYYAGFVAYGENISLTKCIVQGETKTNSSYRGGLVAYIATGTSTIDTCSNSTTILAEYYSSVMGSTYHSYVGGLVGYNAGALTITTSSNTGNVTATTSLVNIYSTPFAYAGGCVGYNQGVLDIKQVSNTGQIKATAKRDGTSFDNASTFAGGLIGHNNASAQIYYCYNTGSVSSTALVHVIWDESKDAKTYGIGHNCDVSNSYNAGDLIGETKLGITDGSVTNCYYKNEDTSVSGSGTGKSDTELKNDNMPSQLNNGTNVFVKDNKNINGGYPIFGYIQTDCLVNIRLVRGWVSIMGDQVASNAVDWGDDDISTKLVDYEGFSFGDKITLKAERDPYFDIPSCAVFEGWKKNGNYIEGSRDYENGLEVVITGNDMFEGSFSDGTYRVSVQAYPEDAGTVCITQVPKK